jgi:DNA polymerase-2
LLEEIARRTGLPVALDGIYRWIVFLPSRQDTRVPVANRYFGVFQDGSLKVRGIEARREDTPRFIAQTQMEILERLAKAPDASQLTEYLPEINVLLQRRLAALRRRQVPLEMLLVSQKLSRSLEEYRCPSNVARAAAQLQAVGKTVRPGQRVQFLYTLGEPGVYAWDSPQPPNPLIVDVDRYCRLLLRAANTILDPIHTEATPALWGSIAPKHTDALGGGKQPAVGLCQLEAENNRNKSFKSALYHNFDSSCRMAINCNNRGGLST